MKFTGHKLSREDKERYNFRGPDERLLQKPIFTNFYERNSAGDIILSSYKIIFLTHKHTIGKRNFNVFISAKEFSQIDLLISPSVFCRVLLSMT